jgi:hypothetical protein
MPDTKPLASDLPVPTPANPDDPVCFPRVFSDELDHIQTARTVRKVVTDKKPKDSLIGLAFSGGGIRSATFNLGVLQTLAQRGLLRDFDYLSTVSGGGYIGSWLAALTLRAATPNDFSAVETALKQPTYQTGKLAECSAIHWLRKYADYLTPQMGVLSPDTAAAVGTWLRNVILNLMVILLVLLAVILLPSTLVHFNWDVLLLHPDLSFVIALLLITLATGVMTVSMTDFGSDRQENRKWWWQRNRVGVLVMAPFFVAAWLMNGAIWIWQSQGQSVYWIPAGAAFYGFIWTFGYLVLKRRNKEVREATKNDEDAVSRLWLAISAFGAGALAGVLLNGYSWLVTNQISVNYDDAWILITVGTVAVLLLMLLTAVVQLGVLGTGCQDLVREWWSRVGGQLMLSGLVWLIAFAIVIFGPLLVRVGMNSAWGKGINLSAAVAWVVSSVAGLIAGKSPATSGESPSQWLKTASGLLQHRQIKEVVAKIAPYIFVAGLLVLLSTAVHILVGLWCEPSLTQKLWFGGPSSDVYDSYWAIQSSPAEHWYYLLAAVATLGVAAMLLSARIDVNDFSMHHFYRNRLVRCYLGASNPDRKPQQYTGFDPHDDVPLAALAESPGPYPILNAALNTSSGKELGFVERKAKSFVFTPLYCGYDPSVESMYSSCATYAPTRLGRNEKQGSKRGLSLGTAMAISGAAASPNMGHYTSPPTAFFMTLFDVRLGWWMGNTRLREKWRSAGPKLGLAYLISELVAHSDEDSNYIYLSDGGHFENLAVYELVKRRCRLIVACDSGADHDYGFGDLIAAIEKCRTDFGVDIKISASQIKPEAGSTFSARNFAVGDIHYGPNDVGKIIYLKSSLPADDVKAPLAARLAAVVRGYAAAHTDFPHQSTADQWFDEMQFEAYRALGEYIASKAGEDIESAINRVLGRSQTLAAAD